MPKKRHQTQYTKPPSTAHRSSLASASAGTAGRNDGPGVNELLSSLRISQTAAEDSRAPPVIVPTLPAAIRHLLNIPDTPMPRPRRGRLFDAQGRRLPAGPAPPESWAENRFYASSTLRHPDVRLPRSQLDHLPGIQRYPEPRSLLASCLRQMSQNWELQWQYNQCFLAAMPTSLRVLLLSYIARYGPEIGVGYEGIKAILHPGHVIANEFSGNDDFNRLDLSGSLGRSLSLKQLQEFITPAPPEDENNESWESHIYHIRPTLRTPITSLKYLSLAHPLPTITWARLLVLSKSLPTLTHLSLAHWPTPNLTPNSNSATFMSIALPPVQYGATGPYSHSLEGDWCDAAAILRRLSTALYSLEWLDLDGCTAWMPALSWTWSRSIDWKGSWSKVGTISMRIGQILEPQSVKNSDLVYYKQTILDALALEAHVRKQRGWIEVVHDEWDKYDNLWQQIPTGGINLPDYLYENARMGTGQELEDRTDRHNVASSRFWD